MNFDYLRNAETCNSETSKQITSEFGESIVWGPLEDRENTLQDGEHKLGNWLVRERGKLVTILINSFSDGI